ncbi:MAG: hypothetical protein AAFN81_18175 [Bacteroidota bacterium]
MPLNLTLLGYERIQAHRRYEDDAEEKMPLLAAQGLPYFGIAFLSIVTYVAWQQGWIINILSWLLYILVFIFQLLAQLVDWVMSLF